MTRARLSGTIVVTGGTCGLGRAISTRLSRAGATVLLTGTNADAACSAAKEIVVNTGGIVHGVGCDVSDESSVTECAERVAELGGAVTALVNNAGVPGRASLTEFTRQRWDTVMAVNATGTYLMSRALLPLPTAPNASIVNISSQAGQRGEVLLSHYAAS
jgi:3-oxoacyl-[acyl-carrier protein] reductase